VQGKIEELTINVNFLWVSFNLNPLNYGYTYELELNILSNFKLLTSILNS